MIIFIFFICILRANYFLALSPAIMIEPIVFFYIRRDRDVICWLTQFIGYYVGIIESSMKSLLSIYFFIYFIRLIICFSTLIRYCFEAAEEEHTRRWYGRGVILSCWNYITLSSICSSRNLFWLWSIFLQHCWYWLRRSIFDVWHICWCFVTKVSVNWHSSVFLAD